MKPRFGGDFGWLRECTGTKSHSADQSAGAVDGRGYTISHDLVFAAEEYAPGTTAGGAPLAHEMTHVAGRAIGLVRDKDSAKRRELELIPVGPLPVAS